MKPIVAIRYRDAFYHTKKKIEDTTLPTYVAVGRPIVSKDHLILSFTEENNLPIRGLLVPNEALIFQEKTPIKVKIPDSLREGKHEIGVFWDDMVYFENGKVPDQPTCMYTEGKFFSQTLDAVVIKNPETIKIGKSNVANHPKFKPTFFVIPKVLITGIEFYDKKL